MKLPSVATIDFETMPIQPRPEYPPKPVGFSLRLPRERRSTYYGWGHPSENNCTLKQARGVLRDVWNSDARLLFHNAKFDVDVAVTHMGVNPPQWGRVEDTMFLLFLSDPHARDIDLKSAAERVLGVAPTERDELREYILANRSAIAARHGHAFTPGEWGSAIAFAPGLLVGRYACGDSDRTLALFKHLRVEIQERGMLDAYDVERELMPILLENERVGMRVDEPALRRDVEVYGKALAATDVWLRKRLKAGSLNLDNDGEVAAALATAGVIDDDQWTLTKTGKRSVSKKFLLPEMFNDPAVASALGYRNRLTTCLKMFMHPWLRQADARGDGYISTNWNQVRGVDAGTRTGRPSTTDPNFLNISKTWEDKDDGYAHPTLIRPHVEPLPLVRRYILPDVGHTFLHRDYNGQELRILGHYEDGALLQAYQNDPRMDVHDFVRQLIENIAGLQYHRTQVKVTNFRRIYGGGVPATAGALNVSLDVAKQLLDAHGKALPGVEGLKRQLTAIAKGGDPIVTWGGREYYVEPARFDKRYGRYMDYFYKLLNYLIQGSAADATKRAIINYLNHPKRVGRFLVTVYDEINSSAPTRRIKHEMQVLRESMEDLAFDVPMLTDGKTGPNWASLTKYED